MWGMSSNWSCLGQDMECEMKWYLAHILYNIETNFNPHLHVWYPYTLKMEAVCSSETHVGIYETTCCCNTRNHNMNLHHLKNLKYYKCKILPVHSMKAHKGRRGTAPLILNLSTRCWVVNIIPWPLYPWERTQVPIKQEAGWAPEPV